MDNKLKITLGKQVKKLISIGVAENEAKIIVSEIYSSIIETIREGA